MGNEDDQKKVKRGRLSLYPMKFEDALKALLKVPPPPPEDRPSIKKKVSPPPS
jgi:hypothetical protein